MMDGGGGGQIVVAARLETAAAPKGNFLRRWEDVVVALKNKKEI